MKFTLTARLLLGIAVASPLVRADVKPCALFTDNAVLQQGVDVPVWGTAREGEKVAVTFGGQTVETTAKDGKWQVILKNLKPGAPQSLTIKGDNVITAQNVLVGEVWVCSGQSNMARTLVPPDSVQPRQPYWEQAAAQADHPEIRHFRVGGGALDEPTREVIGKWEICTPKTAREFTAVGYFFAQDLLKTSKAPVGLLNASVGATGAASWISREGLGSTSEMKNNLDRQERSKADYPAQLAKYNAEEPALLAAWAKATEQAKTEGKPEPRKPTAPRNPFTDAYRPTGYYNSKIAPLMPYAIKGVIWYQGESNSGQANGYRALFTTLIKGWREVWGQGDFPFLFVQLPEYEKTPPEIREVQLGVWKSVPNTGMVVTIDCGDATNIHPPDKHLVGERLALAARAIAYGEKIVWSGPVFDTLEIDGKRAVLHFLHIGGGLVAKNGELKGFTISADPARQVFVPAKAEIVGDTIVVTSDQIVAPKAVRYGWENVPPASLYNREGLPASPFRTDVR